MILGIGTDIVDIQRIEEALTRHGDKFLEKVLTSKERVKYQASHKPLQTLAKFFAAKEATSKAFGKGFREGLSFQHMEVTQDELGKPSLQFSGVVSGWCQEQGVKKAHLSLSDESAMALAFVVLEG